MDTIWQPDITGISGPKYKAVVQAIRAGIEEGSLNIGRKLPPVRELAWQLGITPGTVARAYTILTDEGVLQAEIGRGTFVAKPASDQPYVPLEIDAVEHNSPSDTRRVTLFSPALPNIGQSSVIRELMGKVAANPASGVMHYPTRSGAQPARDATMRWLSALPLGQIDVNDLVLTMGGQHGVVMVLQTILSGRRPTVLVEELAYPGFRRAAGLLRADVVGVPMDEHGIIPEALEAAARGREAQVLCTSPEVHNPTVLKTPLKRRKEIAAMARRCNLQILEDDCYRMGAEREPTYRMLAPEISWYVGSIAKTLTPALRFGYVVAAKGRGGPLRLAKEHMIFGLPTPILDLGALLLDDPRIQSILDRIYSVYRDYILAAARILEGYDVTWRPDVPFLWLKLPSGWRASAFCRAAESVDAPVRSAEEFAAREAHSPHFVRIAVNAAVTLDSFKDAIGRLRDLLGNPPEQIGV